MSPWFLKAKTVKQVGYCGRAFAHSAIGLRIDSSWWTINFSYFLFKPVLHDRYNKDRDLSYTLRNGAYKIFLLQSSRTEETAKAGTCAQDRRALQQLALNVHIKLSDLT